MKRLKSYDYFRCLYMLGAGVLLGSLSVFAKEKDHFLFFGVIFLLFGVGFGICEWLARRREAGIRADCRRFIPTAVQVMPQMGRRVHNRGLFIFVLSCTFRDETGAVRTVQSRRLMLPAWSSHVNGRTLSAVPQTAVYVSRTDPAAYAVEAFL